MEAEVWIPGFVALVFTVATLLVARPLLSNLGVVDVPNHRSSHTTVTLRGGGVGPLVGFITGCVAWIAIGGRPAVTVVIVLVAGTVMAAVGLAEDIRGLPIAVRAGSQIFVGFAVAIALGSAPLSMWIWAPLAAFAFAAYVNFVNFMDGVNGISGLHGFAVGTTFAVIGAIQSIQWLQAVGVVLAISFFAFLPWNFRKPGLFLGDVGSYLLGGAIAAASLGAVASGIPLLAVIAPLSIYLADTIMTIIQRARRREPVLQPHRSHAYQRLTNTGMSHLSVSLTVTAFTLGAGAVGVLYAAGVLNWGVSLGLILVFAGCYLSLPRFRGDALPRRNTFEVGPIEEPREIPQRNGWSPATWAVIGASGFIGSAVSEALEREGVQLRRLAAPRLTFSIPTTDGVEIARIAEERPECAELAQLLEGVDVVINAAGLAAPDGASSDAMYGANALLPALVAAAAARSHAGRVIHLSSVAVQGNRSVLDSSLDVSPFSLYSHSKALGETAVLAVARMTAAAPDVVVVRATSVQGVSRPTTASLKRIAQSPLASVASPGTQPTVVSSVDGLVEFVIGVAASRGPLPPVLLQPWEGLSVQDVLRLAGGKPPRVIAAPLCRIVIHVGVAIAKVMPELVGPVRRVELMWFGQAQVSQSTGEELLNTSDGLPRILTGIEGD